MFGFFTRPEPEIPGVLLEYVEEDMDRALRLLAAREARDEQLAFDILSESPRVPETLRVCEYLAEQWLRGSFVTWGEFETTMRLLAFRAVGGHLLGTMGAEHEA